MNQDAAPILFTRNSGAGDLLLPSYPGDAGFNVVVAETCILKPGRVTRVDLGISIAVPAHLAFTFMTRSGAVSNNLFVLSTLIDSGYRGPLYLFVTNFNEHDVEIKAGMSIAQVVLIDNHAPVPIKLVDALPPSERGDKGFNSSGGGLQ